MWLLGVQGISGGGERPATDHTGVAADNLEAVPQPGAPAGGVLEPPQLHPHGGHIPHQPHAAKLSFEVSIV